jgi:hypothetical protein
MVAGWLKNASKAAAAVVAVATLVVGSAFAHVVVAGGALDSGISGMDVGPRSGRWRECPKAARSTTSVRDPCRKFGVTSISGHLACR